MAGLNIINQIRQMQRALMQNGGIDDDERRLFQHAVSVIQQASLQYRWENAKVTIYLKNGRVYTFTSGDQSNRVVLYLDRTDTPQYYYEHKEWAVWLYDSFRTALDYIPSLLPIVGWFYPPARAITGGRA